MCVGVAFLVFGSGSFGGAPGNVCVTQPGAQYNGSSWSTPFVTARPGRSVSIIGSLQVCADDPGAAAATRPGPDRNRALLTFARIVNAGAPMDAEIQATI